MHLELQWKAVHWSGSYALWWLSALAGFPVFKASRPPVHNSQLIAEGGPRLDEDQFTSHRTIIAAIAPQGRWRPQTAAPGHRDYGSKDHSGWERLPPGMVTWHSSWKHNGPWQIGQEHGGSTHGQRTIEPRATLLHAGEEPVPHVTALMHGSALQIEEGTEVVSAGGTHTSGCQDSTQPTEALMVTGASCHIDGACKLLGGICLNQQHCAIMFFFIVLAGFSCAIVAFTWCSAKRSRSNDHEPDSSCGAPAPVLPPPEAAPPDRPLCQTLAEKVGSKPGSQSDAQTSSSTKAGFPVFRGSPNRRENASTDSISAGG